MTEFLYVLPFPEHFGDDKVLEKTNIWNCFKQACFSVPFCQWLCLWWTIRVHMQNTMWWNHIMFRIHFILRDNHQVIWIITHWRCNIQKGKIFLTKESSFDKIFHNFSASLSQHPSLNVTLLSDPPWFRQWYPDDRRTWWPPWNRWRSGNMCLWEINIQC